MGKGHNFKPTALRSQPPSTSQKNTLDPWLIECRLSPLTQGHFALAEKVRDPPILWKNNVLLLQKVWF
jgi:hypothetical protein